MLNGNGDVNGYRMLENKRLLITGVVTRDSIAFEVARQAQQAGAEIVLTGFGRARRMTERAAAKLPEPVDVLELDVNSDSDVVAVREELESRWERLDGILHAIAFAPGDALGGGFLDTPTTSAVTRKTSSASRSPLGAISMASNADRFRPSAPPRTTARSCRPSTSSTRRPS